MTILGKISLKTLISAGVVETTTVILLCYGLAVSLGHKSAWLPTISACGEEPPEKYFFRWGVFVSSLFPILQALRLRAAGQITNVTCALGFIAGLSLSGVAVVQANEATHIHSIFAVTFFVCEDVKNFLLVMDNYSRMSRTAVVVTLSSNVVASLATIARFGAVFLLHHGFPFVAVFEWANTAALLITEASIAAGLGSLYFGEIESDGITKKKQPG